MTKIRSCIAVLSCLCEVARCRPGVAGNVCAYPIGTIQHFSAFSFQTTDEPAAASIPTSMQASIPDSIYDQEAMLPPGAKEFSGATRIGRWPDNWPQRVNLLFTWLGATAGMAVLTWALILLRAENSTAGILFLLVIVWSATFTGRVLSVYVAVLASLLFDFFFLAPLYTFNLSSFQDWLSMLAFVVSCVVVNRVAERARRQTRRVEQRREDAERLYSLSQEMMLHDDAAGLVRDIPRLVEKNFSLAAVLLYVRDEDQLFTSGLLDETDDSAATSAPGLTDGEMVQTAPDVVLKGRDPEHTRMQDEMRLALQAISAAWEPHPELPHGFTSLNLIFGMSSVGTLAWKPATLSREVATSVAAQVAIAITRAHAIERSARLEAGRAADRLRSALIDSLTHELRTPLTAIRAAATSLVNLEGLDNETRAELALIVDEESARLDLLIGEAMEVAEIESAGVRVKLEPIRVSTFLDHAVTTSYGELAHHRVDVVSAQPTTLVWFDPLILGRVLRHLLENAARYTRPGSCILISAMPVGERLEFVVEDNGPGIDPLDMPLIFDKFYRGKKRPAGGAGAGTGMGLAIARVLMMAHSGGIEAESRLGQGARFRLWVPLLEKAAPKYPAA